MSISKWLLAIIFVLVSQSVLADPRPIKGDAIRSTIGGRTVYLETPFGTELPIHYRKNGTMYGKGGQIARHLSDDGKPTDRGKWWIRGASLCQKWRNWLEGRKHCFSLKLAGNMVYWRNHQGRSGRARLGGRR